MGLVATVSRSLGVPMADANSIIDEQAAIGRDMLGNEGLNIEDVEELMYDMGVEPDYLDEFLMRMI